MTQTLFRTMALSLVISFSFPDLAKANGNCFNTGTRLIVEGVPSTSGILASTQRELQVLNFSDGRHTVIGRLSDARFQNIETNRGLGQGCYRYVSGFSGFSERFFRLGNFSPLLLDLERDGFSFSERGVGVDYDIPGTGTALPIQWVDVGSDDGFLALDLNRNGQIDNGTELFGEGTEIIGKQGKKATHGFIALAQYDSASLGGNVDGFITKDDDIWNQLLLWVDSNADAVTQSSELLKLGEFQITSIPLEPKVVKSGFERFDESGNLIPYWQWVESSSDEFPSKLKLIDVFFAGISE